MGRNGFGPCVCVCVSACLLSAGYFARGFYCKILPMSGPVIGATCEVVVVACFPGWWPLGVQGLCPAWLVVLLCWCLACACLCVCLLWGSFASGAPSPGASRNVMS